MTGVDTQTLATGTSVRAVTTGTRAESFGLTMEKPAVSAAAETRPLALG